MPQFSSNGPPRKRSEPRRPAADSGGTSGIFTADYPDQNATDAESPPSAGQVGQAAPDLSSEITEPFPDSLFRMPLPDSLFKDMRAMSDSAFRALLGLIRLSFRYDPEQGQWVSPERTFSRADVQAECSLSGQGTRNGLSELEERGYVSIDRSGRSYKHRLEMEVPSSSFTYVPTGLFEKASSLSGTELRLVFAVLRATWGWAGEDEGSGQTEHKRWESLSTAALAHMTGRSPSAVKQAAQALQGTWIQRRRPTSGAYCYRFRAEALTAGLEGGLEAETGREPEGRKPRVKKKQEAVFSMGVPNDLPPNRQQSAPPHRGYKESFSKRGAKHSATFKRAEEPPEEPPSRDGDSAVRGGTPPSQGSARRSASSSETEKTPPKQSSHRDPQGTGRDTVEDLNLTGFSDRKRALGQKLANAGVWPRRIPELLGRYSAERIEANFQLYRKRAQQVKKSGAWLAAAIERGYVLPSPTDGSPSDGSPSEPTSASPTEPRTQQAESPDSPGGKSVPALPEPGTKVSQERKETLIQTGQAERADFDRAPSGERGIPRFFYKIEPGPSPAAANLRR